MRITMKSRAAQAHLYCSRVLFIACFLSLTGCALPTAPARPAVYDFGASPPSRMPASTARTPAQAALIVGEIESSPALEGTAMLYRLAYANSQQLQPYTQARWSMPPAQLLRQRLRARLGESYALLNPGDRLIGSAKNTATGIAAPSRPPLNLRLELEEFSQLFDTPELSAGLLRLRATLTQASPTGEQLIAQRSLILKRPAPTPDAPGGVQALAEASEAVALEVGAWVAGVGR
jgi:cholesterol transport system auxiliary component